MKNFLLICLIAISGFVAAQKKVAIYVTGSDEVENSIKKIVADELVSGIVQNKDYTAVERSADFLAEIQKEQVYQRSGNVDDRQICDLGKQFGVDLVCVANITPFRDAFYINARLIDVETASVQATARETSLLNTLDEFVETSESLASKLVGRKAQETASEVLTHEYSLVTSGDPYMTPIEIDNTGPYTKAVFKFVTPVRNRIIVSLSSYAQDDKTGLKYKFIGASGIVADQWTEVDPGIYTFIVSCEKMPDDIEEVTIYYTQDRFWKLRLTPYGKRNYFRFEDRTEELFKQSVQAQNANEAAALQKQAEQARQQDELAQNIANLGDAIANAINSEYILKVTNNRAHTRIVYVDGQRVGEVGGLSVAVFRVSTKFYKTIELVQKNYLFSPSRERFTNPNKPTKAQIVEIVDNPF